jgi:hypothetical protein
MTGTTTALICIDCGKPVHPVHGGEACGLCGNPVYYHDSSADSLRCPGTSPHVRAADPGPAAARVSPFAGRSVTDGTIPAGRGGPRLAALSAAMKKGRTA